MTRAIVVPKPNNVQPIEEISAWTPQQLQLIKDTVARNASNDELQLFLYRCQKMGLDPLKAGQIHFIKYGSMPGTIVVGIEGFRARAARTNKLKGIKRGVIRNDKGECIGGWAKVKRADWDEPAEVEVSLAEYSTGKSNWAKMPETMIQKVAEASALRMAFPDELGDAYAAEEMDKTHADASLGVHAEQPPANGGDGIVHQGYFVPYGPMARKPIEDCDPAALHAYIEEIETKAKRTNKPVPAWAKELIEQAAPLIGAWENEQIRQNREPGDES